MTMRKKKQKVAPLPARKFSDPEQLLAWLKAEGLIREPTPAERSLAAEWDVLPEEEKQHHIRLIRSLALDPPLSQIIIENRR